jgi:SAM-dependent methyltransferase
LSQHWLFPFRTTESNLSRARVALVKRELAPQLAQIFGYHALLYTALAKTLCDKELCIKHQVVIGESGGPVNLQCCFKELPIASDCIDLAVLPEILQASENPHQILREVERVLIPEGVVIIIGRNPFSWHGLKNRLHQKRQNSASQHLDISRRRIADWLRLLGLQTETEINLSVTNQRLQNSQTYPWLKRIGQTFCDWFCSYYIIIARKKVSTLTPIRPSWRRNKQLVPSRLAEPSVRAQVEDWFEQLK